MERISFPIAPARTRYIKLGQGGSWEAECIASNIVRFGFGSNRPERYELCINQRWTDLTETFRQDGKDQGTATRFTNEVRTFFEDDGSILWITFVGIRLYWCFLSPGSPQPHEDGNGVYRQVLGAWCSGDAKGTPLTTDRLSGSLTRLAAYRGTSCDVRAEGYVINRINGVTIPEAERGIAAYAAMQASALEMIRLLGWKDFETLVDLIFTASGWRRVGVVGKTQKSLDLDVILPSTGERALVQIKSTSTSRELADYLAELSNAGPFDRLIYVHHSGIVETDDERALIIGPDKVAELALDAGLMKWLIDKVS